MRKGDHSRCRGTGGGLDCHRVAGTVRIPPCLGRACTRQSNEPADSLGYSGNIIASSLRRNRTDTVGMVVPSIANPFFTSLVVNVEHRPRSARPTTVSCAILVPIPTWKRSDSSRSSPGKWTESSSARATAN